MKRAKLSSGEKQVSQQLDVVIVGAGPYGLSLAAHLHAQNLNFLIFGKPMQTWTSQMPAGTCLKSEGFASTLYDPASAFTLAAYCREKGIPYADLGLPVPLEVFTAYGQEFQRRLVPELKDLSVVAVERCGTGFQVTLENGESVLVERVVVAAGITHFPYLPPELRGLPPELVSHSSQHSSVSRFAGRDVTVLGAGASAMDLAALLKNAGATVRVIARRPAISFHNPLGERSLVDRLRAPMTGLGPGWRSLLCVKAPLLFHRMPAGFRHTVVRKHLGPAPAWFTRQAIVGAVELRVSSTIETVEIQPDGLRLEVKDASGSQWIQTDHLIAATGYRVDLRRLAFLGDALRSGIRSVAHTPVLSTSFESSIQGLYFVGAAAAPSFGPLLRFAYGAGFTARRLSRQLLRSVRAPQPPAREGRPNPVEAPHLSAGPPPKTPASASPRGRADAA